MENERARSAIFHFEFSILNFHKVVQLLLATRAVRMFAYGMLAVVFALYLKAIGLSTAQIGLLITLTLVGDAAVSLIITTRADQIGRKRMLMLGTGLMFAAGVAFLLTQNFVLLVVTATLGIISLSNGEYGPFMSVEQAALAQLVPSAERTALFARYQLYGSFATALGSLISGWLVRGLQQNGLTEIASYRVPLLVYALFGLILGGMYYFLRAEIEAAPGPITQTGTRLGLHQSSKTVTQLSALFGVDSFGSGLITQAFIVLWLNQQFGADSATLGSLFFGVNLLSGLSALASARLAKRIGLINTMVFTHIPANLLVLLVPLMPTLASAMGVLLVRAMLQQMDVAPRQAYVMAVVRPDERSAAAGVTNLGKTIGAALAPTVAGQLMAMPGWGGLPFFAAGIIKIGYDLALYRGFRRLKTFF